MPKKNKSRKYNFENRNCDYCGQFHYKGELTYLGRFPNEGDKFICRECEIRRNAIEASKKLKKEREELKASQPTLF